MGFKTNVKITSPAGTTKSDYKIRDLDSPISEDYLADIAYEIASNLCTDLFAEEAAAGGEDEDELEQFWDEEWDAFRDSCKVEWSVEK